VIRSRRGCNARTARTEVSHLSARDSASISRRMVSQKRLQRYSVVAGLLQTGAPPARLRPRPVMRAGGAVPPPMGSMRPDVLSRHFLRVFCLFFSFRTKVWAGMSESRGALRIVTRTRIAAWLIALTESEHQGFRGAAHTAQS
jgi:cell division inhibitor SulA